MIWRLVRLDLALLRRSRAGLATLLLLIAAGALALASGLDWRDRYQAAIQTDRADVAKARSELLAIYDGIDAGTVAPTDLRAPESEQSDGPFIPDPRDPYVEGFYHTHLAALPPGPLLHLAVGASEFAPNRQILRTVPLSSLARPGEPPEAVNPGALAAGRLDLLAVLIYLAPLVLIALLFDAAARERETGASPVLAALGATRRDLLAARGLIRGGAVAVVMTALILLGALPTGAPVSAVAAFVAGSALYIAFWTSLCLMIASTRLSAVGSASTLAGLWVAVTLLSPSLIERAVRPDGLLSPRALADADVRAVERDWGAPDRTEDRIAEAGTRFWNVETSALPDCARYDAPLTEWSMRWLMDEVYVAAIEAGQSAEARFDAALDRWGWLSPALSFRRAMETVAGSDPARNRAFESDVVDYHHRIKLRGVSHLLGCDPIDRSDFLAAPQFEWREPDLRTAALLGGFGSVFVFALIVLAIALRRSRTPMV